MLIAYLIAAGGICFLAGWRLSRAPSYQEGFIQGEESGRKQMPLLERLMAHPGGVRVSRSWLGEQRIWWYRVTLQSGELRGEGPDLQKALEEAALSVPQSVVKA